MRTNIVRLMLRNGMMLNSIVAAETQIIPLVTGEWPPYTSENYEPIFKQAGLEVDYAKNVVLCLRKLAAGRVDLVEETKLAGWESIKTVFPNEVEYFGTLKKPLDATPLAIMVSRKYPDSASIISQFNAGLQQIKDKGIYKQILMKYGLK